MTETITPPSVDVAARAIDASKIYGSPPSRRRRRSSFVTVSPEEVPVTGEWIATLDGNVNAQIRPQVSGYLIRRAYQEGAYVKKGAGALRDRSAAVRGGALTGAGAARRGGGAARQDRARSHARPAARRAAGHRAESAR